MAGTKVGSAWYELRADDAKLRADIVRSQGDIIKSGNTAGTGFSSGMTRGFAGIKSGLGSITQSLGTVKGAAIGIGAAFAATKVISFFGDAIGAASDLGETVSKVGVIFGQEALGGLEKWAEGAASAMGQSKQQALDAAATFATFGKSAGLAGTDLVGFSTELVELSSDLASFHNAEPQEVIDALGAALRGEAEPMRRFGVLLDDATLRNRAFEMGIISTTKNALTPQQKVLAAQAEILAQTGDAQGDFERTSGGLANQQRILAAELDNATVKIGELLLPAMVAVASFAVDVLIPALTGIIDVISGVAGAIGEGIGGAVQAVTEFDLSVQLAFGNMGDVVSDRADAIGVDVVKMKDAVYNAMTGMGLSLEDALVHAEQTLQGIPFAMTNAGMRATAAWKQNDLGGMVAADLTASAGEVAAGAEAGIGTPTEAELEETRLAAEEAGRAMSADYASEIAGGADDVQQAWEAMLSGAETEMSDTARIADIQAKLTSPKLRNALNSEDPYLRAQAIATKGTLLEQLRLLEAGAIGHALKTGQSLPNALNSLRSSAGTAAFLQRTAAVNMLDAGTAPTTHGSNISSRYGTGIGSHYYEVIGKASNIRGGVVSNLNNQGGVYDGGAAIGATWMSGMLRAIHDRMALLYGASAEARNVLGGSLPEKGPLKGKTAERGGRSIGSTWVMGLASELAKAPGVIGNPLRGLGGLSVGPVPISTVGAFGAGAFGGGGNSTHLGGIVINITGFAGTQDDVENVSRRLADSIRLRAASVY